MKKDPVESRHLTSEQAKDQIEKAVKMILQAIGENLDREDLEETPKRVAKFLMSYSPDKDAPEITKFKDSSKGMVIVVKDLEVRSMCAHHLLPFFGKASIGYIPNGYKAGLSKFQRAVDYISERPQNQEDITSQLMEFLTHTIEPRAIIIRLECTHTCMMIRGVKCHNSSTVTMLSYGGEKDVQSIIDQII